MTALPGRLVLLGHPVGHSLSPRFQNAALTRAGIALRYEALDVAPDELDGCLSTLAACGAAGNVTIPHKEGIARRCAHLTPLARRIGAVNTFWHQDGLLCGDNTDVVGFLRAVDALAWTRRPERVAVLGAGGAAAAVCEAVSDWPSVQVRIWSRTPARARSLVERFGPFVAAAEHPIDAVARAQLVVNATPIGLRDDALPIPIEDLPDDAAVTDLVYRAGSTRWVREARAAGHPAIDGLVMLVEQGAASFCRWFGIAPDRRAMWDAVDS